MTDKYRDAVMKRPLSNLLSGDGRLGPDLLWEIDSLDSVDQLRAVYDRLTQEISHSSRANRKEPYPPWPFLDRITAGGPSVEEACRATRAVFFILYHWPKPGDIRSSDEIGNAFSRFDEVKAVFGKRIYDELIANAQLGQEKREIGARVGASRSKATRDAKWLERLTALQARGVKYPRQTLFEELLPKNPKLTMNALNQAITKAKKRKRAKSENGLILK